MDKLLLNISTPAGAVHLLSSGMCRSVAGFPLLMGPASLTRRPTAARLPPRILVTIMIIALMAPRGSSSGTCGCSDSAAEDCIHVLLATPCYSGSVTESYLLSVARTFQHFACSRIQLHVATVPGIADLPKARGALISQFLAGAHYNFVFFADADVEWAPAMMERFVTSGHDMVAAMYPKKQLDWGRLQETVRNRKLTEAELRSAVMDYPIEFEFEDGTSESTGTVDIDANGMCRVRRAGAGFLMVSKAAMAEMAEAYEELAYVDPPSGETHYGLFYNGFEGPLGDRRWVSEDFAFCDRWRAIGGSVWVDLTTGLNHTGSFRYEGAHWIERYKQQPAPPAPVSLDEL